MHSPRGGAGAASATPDRGKRLTKVAAELARLASDGSAVHWGSAILVRSDERAMDHLRAAILGPEGTPYANGVYLFDIILPPDYPNTNPGVQFLTTGGGLARFNPNLYADGKVCLSLLGTWDGPGWIPGTSTLSQVLISIQSSILVDMPWANEPGSERVLHTPEGKRAVARHNSHVRLATLQFGIIEAMTSPPRGFEAACAAHFWFKREELRAQVLLWAEEALVLARYEEELRARMKSASAVMSVVKKAVRYNVLAAAQSDWGKALMGHEVWAQGACVRRDCDCMRVYFNPSPPPPLAPPNYRSPPRHLDAM